MFRTHPVLVCVGMIPGNANDFWPTTYDCSLLPNYATSNGKSTTRGESPTPVVHRELNLIHTLTISGRWLQQKRWSLQLSGLCIAWPHVFRWLNANCSAVCIICITGNYCWIIQPYLSTTCFQVEMQWCTLGDKSQYCYYEQWEMNQQQKPWQLQFNPASIPSKLKIVVLVWSHQTKPASCGISNGAICLVQYVIISLNGHFYSTLHAPNIVSTIYVFKLYPNVSLVKMTAQKRQA